MSEERNQDFGKKFLFIADLHSLSNLYFENKENKSDQIDI